VAITANDIPSIPVNGNEIGGWISYHIKFTSSISPDDTFSVIRRAQSPFDQFKALCDQTRNTELKKAKKRRYRENHRKYKTWYMFKEKK
jgi:hypothetical protein